MKSTFQSHKQVRQNWEKAFENMNQESDDSLIIDAVFENEEFEKWD
ncbi:hypothetical protein [Leeuwenhoekiella parthenopeia]|uniref:Uncharacterized protein n=1 Tax=Leeuwenhoekiella parthenopeia TaxID=2890320 RepID=A0ABS8GTZ5_9FLAO|nr:hypothetical protein [Leeuwenhoekiella parthenopeia]MCC4212581.1 hypothetical protein [Leeuwenhoekiella parthenopeia]